MNTGSTPVLSEHGLITTVAFKLGETPAQYASEGSIAVTGALVQWVRDNLGLIEKSSDIETLARTVKDNGGVYFVPAFSGLYAPYWQATARGVIAGLTQYANKGHLARAVLEATAYQAREVAEAIIVTVLHDARRLGRGVCWLLARGRNAKRNRCKHTDKAPD